jgi:hypothetical protein
MRKILVKSGIVTVVLCAILAIIQGLITLASKRHGDRTDRTYPTSHRLRHVGHSRDIRLSTDLITTSQQIM